MPLPGWLLSGVAISFVRGSKWQLVSLCVFIPPSTLLASITVMLLGLCQSLLWTLFNLWVTVSGLGSSSGSSDTPAYRMREKGDIIYHSMSTLVTLLVSASSMGHCKSVVMIKWCQLLRNSTSQFKEPSLGAVNCIPLSYSLPNTVHYQFKSGQAELSGTAFSHVLLSTLLVMADWG